MSINVVLAVGVDSWLLTAHSALWRSDGYIVISVNSLKEAIDHFRTGDFDLVLLGHAIAVEEKESLTLLIRAAGSRTPILCIADHSGNREPFADATVTNDSSALLRGMGELLARESQLRAVQTRTFRNAT
jgi:DNA-binding NtrC family response regulator